MFVVAGWSEVFEREFGQGFDGKRLHWLVVVPRHSLAEQAGQVEMSTSARTEP